jgi:hypothetical protein
MFKTIKGNKTIEMKVLLDTGAEGLFMDRNYADEHNIILHRVLKSGWVRFFTQKIHNRNHDRLLALGKFCNCNRTSKDWLLSVASL